MVKEFALFNNASISYWRSIYKIEHTFRVTIEYMLRKKERNVAISGYLPPKYRHFDHFHFREIARNIDNSRQFLFFGRAVFFGFLANSRHKINNFYFIGENERNVDISG